MNLQVIELFLIIHPDAKVEQVQDVNTFDGQVKLIQNFCKTESRKETKLSITLNSMLETVKRNSEVSQQASS